MLSNSVTSHFTLRYLLIIVGIFSVLLAYNFWADIQPIVTGHDKSKAPPPIPYRLGKPVSNVEEKSCIGPRGKLISENPEDQVLTHKLGPYKPTFAGSYDALGLEDEWTTAEERWGPYGYGTDPNQLNGNWRSPVDWERVNWGYLQERCQIDNMHRFPESGRRPFRSSERRLRLRTIDDPTGAGWLRREVSRLPSPAEVAAQRSGKTLLVLRSYGQYEYTEEDKMNIRSILSEASLQSGGEYTVMLYVNIRDETKRIFDSEERYNKAFMEANIPEEFHNISVLWDENLLKSWYPKVDEHGIFYQINQAFQLLAPFYPEFDHFWQLEMDMRSLGHWLKMLRAVDRFGQEEPRKQMWERASFVHLPDQQGPYYPDFISKVNASLDGGTNIWGPVRISEVRSPVGPTPPFNKPEDDNFTWGIGEPADLIVTSACSWVFRMRYWGFRGWFRRLNSMGFETPRITCPPATQRASRQLLLTAHAAQAEKGLALPSEATFPTLALWHGLKISLPPWPWYQRQTVIDARTKDVWFNGGHPGERVRTVYPLPEQESELKEIYEGVEMWWNGSLPDDRPIAAEWRANGTDPLTIPWKDDPWRDWYNGFGAGECFMNQPPLSYLAEGISYWWSSSFPRRILDVWSGGGLNEGRATAEAIDEERAIDEAKRNNNMEEYERLMKQRQADEEREAEQLLRWHDGRWYAPPLWMHPAKTRKRLD